MDSTAGHYTVLARRFRPQTFDDVIGQQHVAQSLKNAIASNRVAHAYLFTGARGVGKTSMARIFAKALNCPNVKDGVPCNNCEVCNSISTGNDVDVMEIDGASNNGVEDVRAIRANVSVKSMRTKFKMYVIDEVHMLSKSAFNALLKTLEEPPPNVKFVFCTTEPNRLPDTILSRCQRFDFAAIETQNIVNRLQQIAETEGYQVDAAALELVARRAAGSMRDSQSLFDQLLAFGEEHITAADVHRLLGTADDDRLIGLADALSQRDRKKALEEFSSALNDGVQLNEFVDQIIHYFRDLMVIAAGSESVPLLSVSPSQRPELQRQAEVWGIETIVAALQILSEAKTRMFRTVFARALAEVALVRISLLEDLDAITALARSLADGSGGTSAVPQQSPGRSRPTAPPPSSPRNSTGPVARQTASPPPKPARETGTHLQLVHGSESDILSQLIEKSDDATGTHLTQAALAISGPNQVDLLFPANYHFSGQYCDKTDVRSRLEELLAEITGKTVALTIKSDGKPAVRRDNGADKPVPQPKTASVNLEQAESDSFVQEAKEIFGGTVKDIKPL